MSTTKAIAGVIPGVMAAGLLAHNVGALDFDVNPKKRKKENHIKRITKLGITNLIAIPLIGVTAGAIGRLP